MNIIKACKSTERSKCLLEFERLYDERQLMTMIRSMISGSRHVPAKCLHDVIAKITSTRGCADRQPRVKRKKHGVHRPGVVAQRSDAR